MADDDLVVTISGPALSLLLFENARCQDQIGFLLGEIQIFVTKTVTDERVVENIKTHINIKSIVPHPMGCEAFFNSSGEVIEDVLREFLQDDIHKVVGWYHYRYNFKIDHASMRDRGLHTSMSKFFSNLIKLQKQENFLFFLMVTNENQNHSTHKFKHLLYRKEGRACKSVSFRINNLGADATRPDGSDYKPAPKYTSCQNDSFDKVYDQLRNDLKRVSGVEAVQLIEKGAEAFLAQLVPQVNRTDKKVTELSEELYEMRHNFHKQRFERIRAEEMGRLRESMGKCSMDVDTQSDTTPGPFSSPSLVLNFEPKSPESPLMVDPPKISPSSSNVKLATKKTLKQESSEECTRDPTSSEREINQTKYDSPRSPQGSSKRSEWKTVQQRTAEFESNVKASTKSSPTFDRKGGRKSAEYGRRNS